MRCVLVKLQCWGSGIKLLDGIWETAVQLSVHTVYRYGGHCCMCHGGKSCLCFDKIGFSHAFYLTLFRTVPFPQIHILLHGMFDM